MTSREDLIEEAAKAIHDVAMREYPGMPADIYGWDVQKDRDRDVYLLEARAALAVFEQAHAPTGDERVVPGFAEREKRATSAWELFTHTDREMSHDFRSGYHQGVLDEARRTVQGEPSDAQIEAGAKALRDDKANRVDAYAVPAWENTSYGDKLLYRGQSLAVLRAAAENNEREEKD